MEVMGLMLGEFVDDYTVRVVDVFAMPQSGTGVSVEAVDPVFQTKMLDMLKQVGRCVGQQQGGRRAPKLRAQQRILFMVDSVLITHVMH
jgi:26S proteasome regulatory subunit N11